MSQEIQTSVIEKIKEALGTECEDVYQLYQMLVKKMPTLHPDRFQDEAAKKTAEEQFKQLSQLRKEFDIYIENLRLQTQLAVIDEHQEACIDLLRQNSKKEDEIRKLQTDLHLMEYENLNLKKKLKEVNEKYEQRISSELQQSKENLSSIYKPSRFSNVVGIVSMVATFSVLLPQVRTLISTLGLGGCVGSALLLVFAVLWLFSHFRNYCAKQFMESMLAKIFSSGNINNLLNIKPGRNPYESAYFSENDVYSCVHGMMSKRWVCFLFWGSFDKLKKDIVETLILELEARNLIVGTRNRGLQKEFLVNKLSSGVHDAMTDIESDVF
ncbi:MAG: hypothetical protein IIX13_01280 [Bacteroidales bacterium]|nr:hypothetical protein [Bacteroidales bacterium]